jgi:dephospho-CoA kinase
MLRVGLTGGLASGKSFVGRTFQQFGCYLVRADDLGHEVLKPGGEAYEATVREFGRDILQPDGVIDRRALAAKVFGEPDNLEKLNRLVHPPVRARIRKLLDAYERENPDGIAIVEAAILVETGSYRDYAKLIVAVCRPEQQIERAMARDGMTREQALERLKRQMPLEEKIKYADYVIDTSGSKENTVAQTRAVYEALKGRI